MIEIKSYFATLRVSCGQVFADCLCSTPVVGHPCVLGSPEADRIVVDAVTIL